MELPNIWLLLACGVSCNRKLSIDTRIDTRIDTVLIESSIVECESCSNWKQTGVDSIFISVEIADDPAPVEGDEDRLYSRYKKLFSVCCYHGGEKRSGNCESSAQDDEEVSMGFLEDDFQYLYRTNLFIDWDRRTTLSKNLQVMSSIRYEEEREVHRKYIVETEERPVDGKIHEEASFLSKMKKAGRYKYTYEIYEDKVLENILGNEMDRIVQERCCEEMLLEEEVGRQVQNADMDNVNVALAPNVEVVDAVLSEVASVPDVHGKEMERRLRMKMRTEGIKGTGMKPMLKRQKRQRGDITTFKLRDGIRTKQRDNTCLKNDEEWFAEASRVCKVLLGYLGDQWVEVPHLRCVHIKEKSRRMISVATARVKEVKGDGTWREVLTIGIMVEELSKDVNCINVIHRINLSSSGRLVSHEEVVCFS